MKQEIIIGKASSETDLQQILKLQAKNHISGFSSDSIEADGFLTVKHDLEMLKKMNLSANQIIAKVDNEIVGYALAILKQSQQLIPTLIPMFEFFNTLSYKGKKLEHLNYYVMGQVCIAKAYRKQGIFNKLYQQHKDIYGKEFECSVTEVAVRNIHSMKVHEHLGFETIHTYFDETDEWNVLLWYWK